MFYQHALRPAWTPLTIVLMVVGFAIAWPLGLVMLAYILWGHKVPEIRQHFEGTRREWQANARDWCRPRGTSYSFSRSGNVAFDDYRERELKRLDEERRKLEEERQEFEAYVQNLRRARDKEEFDRFRNDRANRRPPANSETIDL
jgi:hypothetical protein